MSQKMSHSWKTGGLVAYSPTFVSAQVLEHPEFLQRVLDKFPRHDVSDTSKDVVGGVKAKYVGGDKVHDRPWWRFFRKRSRVRYAYKLQLLIYTRARLYLFDDQDKATQAVLAYGRLCGVSGLEMKFGSWDPHRDLSRSPWSVTQGQGDPYWEEIKRRTGVGRPRNEDGYVLD